MVKFSLQIQATLEAVEKLSTSHPDYQWFLKLKCENCGETSGKFHDLMESEKFPLKHNRSESNLLLKCKLCSRENTVDIIEGSNDSYTAADSGKYKGIVVFACRGVEPLDFNPRSGWLVESEDNGKKFQDIDLSEKEWVEYDDINNTSVGIYEFKSKFVKVK